jgi:hypothetical protein
LGWKELVLEFKLFLSQFQECPIKTLPNSSRSCPPRSYTNLRRWIKAFNALAFKSGSPLIFFTFTLPTTTKTTERVPSLNLD